MFPCSTSLLDIFSSGIFPWFPPYEAGSRPVPSSSGVCSPKMRRTSARSTAAEGFASAPMASAEEWWVFSAEKWENLWKTYGKLETSRKMMWPYQTVEQFLLIASFELIVPQAPQAKA